MSINSTTFVARARRPRREVCARWEKVLSGIWQVPRRAGARAPNFELGYDVSSHT